MDELAPHVVRAGRLEQTELADLLRRSPAFCLPSLTEGLPLVVVEALACGARPVATALPGVRALAHELGDALELVPPPRMDAIDTPSAADLPRFTAGLAAALRRAFARGPLSEAHAAAAARPFMWNAVFERVERAWSP
jgi:glycosyltransferase involved in cell wall biosynthesis